MGQIRFELCGLVFNDVSSCEISVQKATSDGSACLVGEIYGFWNKEIKHQEKSIILKLNKRDLSLLRVHREHEAQRYLFIIIIISKAGFGVAYVCQMFHATACPMCGIHTTASILVTPPLTP